MPVCGIEVKSVALYALYGAVIAIMAVATRGILRYRKAMRPRLGVPVSHLSSDRTLLKTCQDLKPYYKKTDPSFGRFIAELDEAMGKFLANRPFVLPALPAPTTDGDGFFVCRERILRQMNDLVRAGYSSLPRCNT